MASGSRPRSNRILLLSHLIAAALGYWLWSHKIEVAATVVSIASGGAEIIINQLEWFQTAKPAGIKLHLQLAQSLGLVGITYIILLQNICSSLPTSEILELFITVTAVLLPLVGLGGGKFQSGTGAAKGLYIFTIPITFAYVVMTFLYRWHLNVTIHTWLSMRGKVPLLPRSSLLQLAAKETVSAETAEVNTTQQQPLSPTQLAVSSLLFMPCVLTLPTTAWFYAFWSAVQLICYGLPAMMLVMVAAVVAETITVGNSSSQLELLFPTSLVDVLHQWLQGYTIFTMKY